ncbi:hypothetical protein BH24GEM3_BH24GEM3_11380 [soil metagenome]
MHDGPAAAHAHPAAPALAAERARPSDYSLYNLESEWCDQHGQPRQLGSLAGRVQVVAMVYTHRAYAFPRILMDLKRIEGELAAEHADDVGFVLVSIDPERDTPERLRHFAEATHRDPARWTLLSGTDADLLELAALLGVKYRRESATDFSHSNAPTILTPQGEIAQRQLGLGVDPQQTLAVIRRLLK